MSTLSRRVESPPQSVDVTLRMTVNERLQHAVMFVSFTLLAITGFVIHIPRGVIRTLGLASATLFDVRGLVHRGCGVVLMAVSIYHVFYLLFTERGRWQLREMIPGLDDWREMKQMLRHFRDPAVRAPRFGWYNYAEKAEYWALVWGTGVMALTGVILWMEEWSPKIVIDVATVVHRYEAILAVLAVIVWHFYHVHMAPEVFPTSPVWWSGRERHHGTNSDPDNEEADDERL